ncbi:hypothetical protein TNCV_3342991 [Trichonephila clavipes]|nr:hypothetical protein TNCV_3342991 [Trichonephila clavipes]
MSPAWCSQLRLTTGVRIPALSHDEFRGPRSDFVRQRYRTLNCITFQDGNQFNSCQVIYSQILFGNSSKRSSGIGVDSSNGPKTRLPLFDGFFEFCLAMKRTSGGMVVNKQNCRIWNKANPQCMTKHPYIAPENDCLVRFKGWWNQFTSKTMKATTLQSMVIGIEP